MTKDPTPLAFPQAFDTQPTNPGMGLRDYIAALLAANNPNIQEYIFPESIDNLNQEELKCMKEAALSCYFMADALIWAREQPITFNPEITEE